MKHSLPMEGHSFYSHLPRFYVAVDCIIFTLIGGRLNILLVRRDFEPEKGKWSLIGGFVKENESVDLAARRVLHDLTGLDNVFISQVGAFGDLGRDPGARVISVAYCALINFDEHDHQRIIGYGASWVPLEEMPQLYFDHPKMVEMALASLRRKFSSEPIGFNLLPEYFTLTQLQSLYESVLGEPLDKRNFRKRIADIECIEKTQLIDKSSSRRGAFLYRFDSGKYKATQDFKL